MLGGIGAYAAVRRRPQPAAALDAEEQKALDALLKQDRSAS
ncbi:MAG: cytochrome c-type biogenesis protein CcmH [Pseudomonadota bacterium]|nr:cytochrome c-type biogenesis protein CcmH [Pseudomonadota bacterium]